MRRTLLIVALGLGVVLGYASGFAHLHGRRHHGHAPSWCEQQDRAQGSPRPGAP